MCGVSKSRKALIRLCGGDMELVGDGSDLFSCSWTRVSVSSSASPSSNANGMGESFLVRPNFLRTGFGLGQGDNVGKSISKNSPEISSILSVFVIHGEDKGLDPFTEKSPSRSGLSSPSESW